MDTNDEGECSKHPCAPHGFNRNGSHSEDRYVCECENWSPDRNCAGLELLEALKMARAELAGLPRSLGYDFTHLPKIDAVIAKHCGHDAAPAEGGQGEVTPVGTLVVAGRHYPTYNFIYKADLPRGSYSLYTTPPAASVDVEELMVLVRDIEYRVRYLDGEAWELGIEWAKKLRALLDSAGGAESEAYRCDFCGSDYTDNNICCDKRRDYIAEFNTSQPAEGDGAVAGWIVANGQGVQWRRWGDFGPEWTPDREQAIRFARRMDAEAFAHDDEDAWLIQRYSTRPAATAQVPEDKS